MEKRVPSLLLMVQWEPRPAVWYHLALSVCHGFRSKEVRFARKQKNYYAKQHHTPHCCLLVKVMYPANSTKCLCWLTHSSPIFIAVEG